jgi:hypothetical protein
MAGYRGGMMPPRSIYIVADPEQLWQVKRTTAFFLGSSVAKGETVAYM